MHGIPKNRCRRSESGAKARPKVRRVYPTRPGAATNGEAVFGSKTAISASPHRDRLPIPCLHLSLADDRPFPVPEHLFGAAGELFCPSGADARSQPPADQAEPGLGDPPWA